MHSTVTLTVTSNNTCTPQTAQTNYSVTVLASACIRNVNTNTYYPTIQDAIDNAIAGDELEIGAGTYGTISPYKEDDCHHSCFHNFAT